MMGCFSHKSLVDYYYHGLCTPQNMCEGLEANSVGLVLTFHLCVDSWD